MSSSELDLGQLGRKMDSLSLSSTSDHHNDPLYDLSDEGSIAPPPPRHRVKKRREFSVSSLSSGSQALEVSGEESETESGFSSPKRRRMSIEDSRKERNKWLGKLKKLESTGVFPSRRFTTSDNVRDMKDEHDILTRESRVDKSTETMFNALAAVIGGLEMANGKYDPLNLKLTGWRANIDESRSEVKECFEEIYEKYFENMEAIPEVRLMMIIFSSALMTHIGNSLAPNRAPGAASAAKPVMNGPKQRAKKKKAPVITDAVGVIE